MSLNRSNIWNEAQNKVTYVVNDLHKYVSEDIVYESLLRRGVFKWLSVRRHLIKLKNKWKTDICGLQKKKTEYEKGYLAALEKCRQEVRELCHSDRWTAPDYDGKACKWLKEYENKVHS